ncbi:Gfo/Idh/MocA family oxidoreductase [Algisphaera agarilytica]|uniref:D-galacturonate reductase n=1 Tax=Algisphaera agarilytica TaxID=1385975 RepID=A0A7X0LJQ8_9BACT|nr:Gfo/Idh/MocA family oxidoreductase [Algisphaera agarilytica]MBB6428208.1 D-galacturonate reductase [Algisphaera agarilytica]
MNTLLVGTGEYTTGYVHGQESQSDKGAGVIGLSAFYQRALGQIDRVLMAGTNGTKFPGIREHLGRVLGERYRDLSTDFESFPADDCARDPEAYLKAMDELSPGDTVMVFTPDDTHFTIGMAAVERGLHVLIAKPIVQTVADHKALIEAGDRKGVLVAMEVHKRWDPIYADARDKIRDLGDFSFYNAYMSQPKSQLETFRAWAGKSSDISYYLNAHHIDFHNWSVGHRARPVSVTALGATGVAQSKDIDTEDTITLAVKWENTESGNLGTALYTSSWIAPKSDVHSQQRFHYMGHEGEIQVDQAHRGYQMATDADGFRSPNPLFMKYLPNDEGKFAGASGYGYLSIEAFIQAAHSVNDGKTTAVDWDGKLATARQTLPVTAILEAGRRSLDANGATIQIDEL